jgi:hypothetical protein
MKIVVTRSEGALEIKTCTAVFSPSFVVLVNLYSVLSLLRLINNTSVIPDDSNIT